MHVFLMFFVHLSCHCIGFFESIILHYIIRILLILHVTLREEDRKKEEEREEESGHLQVWHCVVLAALAWIPTLPTCSPYSPLPIHANERLIRK